jgi:N-acetylneuraminate synthase/N,N'-diacetyllegionaminate synthase
MKFLKRFQIENRWVGEGEKCFVIAEIGVNHNGDISLGKKIIDAAVACGVDCVKFQSFRAEEFMADRELEYHYVSKGEAVKEKMFDMFKRLELTEKAHIELFEYARKKGVIPLTSVADPESASLALQVGVGALKLASEDLINLPLLDYVSKLSLPLILSTGMANEEEIEDALKILEKNKKSDVQFLHCVSVYPTPDMEVGLRRMLALRQKTGASVGYSDHSLGIEASVGAVALGATLIEKHFTTDRNLEGPDHALSSDPEEMTALVKSIRRMESFLGQENLAPSPTEEAKSRKEFRRSLVASKDFPAGHRLIEGDLCLKRPGTGLRARELPLLLGKTLNQPLKTDEAIAWDHLSGGK